MVKRKGLSSLINLIAIVVLFFILQAVSKTSRSMNDLLIQIGYSIIMATSLNLACGYLGELPLGHAGFMSVGAYTAAVLTAKFLPQTQAVYPFALLCGGLMAALFAFIIGVPALRLKGDYLAIVTLGFGEIIRVLINTVFSPLTDGGKGLFGIPTYAGYADTFFITALCVCALYMLIRSRHGRATIAIRENDIAAESSGVNVSNYKVKMFVISAFFAGIAGGIYAHQLGVLTAAKFDFNRSIDYLVMVVFGGMGSLTGSIFAASSLTIVQFLMASLVEYRQLAYALLLIAMMIFRPKGIFGRWEFSLTKALSRFIPALGAEPKNAAELAKDVVMPDTPEYTVPKDQPVLRTSHLGIRFGGLQAADSVEIALQPGEIVGLIGPNGAGKTTVFNMLTGVYKPTDGDIRLLGQSIVGKSPCEITASGIARTFQNIRLFKSMTVLENIEVAFHTRMHYTLLDSLLRTKSYHRAERGAREKALQILSVFGMQDMADQPADSLPYGMQRRLEICRALAASPKVLLLDEPAAGMNPTETRDLMETIGVIRDKFGVTILLIEHDMKLVMGICERIYVLNYGSVIAEGTPDEIRNNPEVITAYLGKNNPVNEGANIGGATC